MTAQKKVAIIATSNGKMGDTGEATGVWLGELTGPYYVFLDAGYDVTVYSISGGKIPVDHRSVNSDGKNEPSVERYFQDDAAKWAMTNTPSIEQVNVDEFDAFFLPGGHGTLWDYPQSERLQSIVRTAFEAGKVVAAVCHGPSGLVNVTLTNGNNILKGRRVTGFTNTEEAAVGLTDVVPFLLETRMRERGGNYTKGENFKPYAVHDGNLITGQNPASSVPAAKLVIEALKETVAVSS